MKAATAEDWEGVRGWRGVIGQYLRGRGEERARVMAERGRRREGRGGGGSPAEVTAGRGVLVGEGAAEGGEAVVQQLEGGGDVAHREGGCVVCLSFGWLVEGLRELRV